MNVLALFLSLLALLLIIAAFTNIGTLLYVLVLLVAPILFIIVRLAIELLRRRQTTERDCHSSGKDH